MKPLSLARLATAVARLNERMNSSPTNLTGLLQSPGPQDAGKKRYLR